MMTFLICLSLTLYLLQRKCVLMGAWVGREICFARESEMSPESCVSCVHCALHLDCASLWYDDR
jgi:hypothetical protein